MPSTHIMRQGCKQCAEENPTRQKAARQILLRTKNIYPYISDLYSSAISSTLVSRGLPGRQASA